MQEIQNDLQHYTELRDQLQARLTELLQTQEAYQKLVDEHHAKKRKLSTLSTLTTVETNSKVTNKSLCDIIVLLITLTGGSRRNYSQ